MRATGAGRLALGRATPRSVCLCPLVSLALHRAPLDARRNEAHFGHPQPAVVHVARLEGKLKEVAVAGLQDQVEVVLHHGDPENIDDLGHRVGRRAGQPKKEEEKSDAGRLLGGDAAPSPG